MRRSFATLLCLAVLICSAPSRAEDSLSEDIRQQTTPLLQALKLLGTPYKFGGSSPDKGVDCSGLVRHVYKQGADIALPRSAKAMSQNGEAVAKADLKPGDLVFFNTLKRPFSHVGIYAGDGKFVHASSRREKQVTISNLDDGYWAKRFNGARRLVQPQ
ncbi:NlpC/P60 family protein [Sulfuritortus calidifontis]|uniref:NlpC/P60 family protein n=1 Tax=Sulfuritortus calidifontis TaxID=1914471 RepID=A0A4R3JTQ6_9PROT|nr:C40 family peptidase [Sulfuritortus calidifontis]TCS70885.1 NlpC/P60 family protein [Sulfuritortus calidifontis]